MKVPVYRSHPPRTLAAAVLALHVAVLAALAGAGAVHLDVAPPVVAVRLIEAPAASPTREPLPPLRFALPAPALSLPPVEPPRIPVVPFVAPMEEARFAAAPGQVASTAGAGTPGAGSTPAAVAAAPQAPAAPVVVQQLSYARFDPPAYPPLSRRLGETGLVMLRVVIDEHGIPREVSVYRSSGHERLDRAALEAVRRARFHPHRENDQARTAVGFVPVRFELT